MQVSLHLRPPTLGQETLPPPQSSQSPDTGAYCITSGGAPTATAVLFYVLPFSFLVSGFCNYYCCQRTGKISVKLTRSPFFDKTVLNLGIPAIQAHIHILLLGRVFFPAQMTSPFLCL